MPPHVGCHLKNCTAGGVQTKFPALLCSYLPFGKGNARLLDTAVISRTESTPCAEIPAPVGTVQSRRQCCHCLGLCCARETPCQNLQLLFWSHPGEIGSTSKGSDCSPNQAPPLNLQLANCSRMAPAVWDRRSRAMRIPYPAIGAVEAEQLVGTRPARFVCLQYSSLSTFPDSGLAFPAPSPSDADLTTIKKGTCVFPACPALPGTGHPRSTPNTCRAARTSEVKAVLAQAPKIVPVAHRQHLGGQIGLG